MKTICIIDDHRPFWAEIEECLADVNAQCYFVDEESSIGGLDTTPDLMIMGPASYGKIKGFLPPVKVLVIDDDGPHAKRPGEKASGDDVVVAGWPMSPGSLLALTSDLLEVAERRHFKALIRIYPREKDGFQMGESLDFSLTGMSFAASGDLSVGNTVEVSFFIPKARKHVRVPVEIMRAFPDPSEDQTVYGGRFSNVDRESNDLIVSFIAGD